MGGQRVLTTPETFYEVEAEFLDYECAVDDLSEMFLVHNEAGVRCNNQVNTTSPVPCQICQKETGDPYFVWKLTLRVKRLEVQ